MKTALTSITVCSVICLPVGAFAQALDTAECGAVEEQVMTLLDADFGIEVVQSPTSVSSAGPDGCQVSDLDIYVEALGVAFRAERLNYAGTNLLEWDRGQVVLPTQLELQIEGLALNPDRFVPDDLLWLRDVRAEEISLAATWDDTTQRLQISPLRLDFGEDNIVTLTLDGQAFGWQPFEMPSLDFGVTEVALDVTFNGLFEQAIAPPIVQNGNDLSPASMSFLAAMADGMMASAPPTLVSSDARAAMVGFLRSLPAPRGCLSLAFTNDVPISLERILLDLRTGVPFSTAVPDTVNIDASWQPQN